MLLCCFLLLGVAPQGGSSSFLLLVGTIRLLVDECVLTLWQRTKNKQFLRVNIIYFYRNRWLLWSDERFVFSHFMGISSYYLAIFLQFDSLSQKVAIMAQSVAILLCNLLVFTQLRNI